MSRVKIEMPEAFLITLSIPVRITDINYGNHLGNDSLVSILHEARVIWLKEHDYTELDAAGAGLIMSDLMIEYSNESFYGDTLMVSLTAADISRVSFDLLYKVETKRGGKNIIIAKAKTAMVCYDYAGKKIVAVPENLKKILTGNNL